MLKRGYVGVYHKMSEKHLQRYVDEYVGRHNGRQDSTMENISKVAKGMLNRRLTYEELTAELPPENTVCDLSFFQGIETVAYFLDG